jgi:hypothetical protein
LKRYIDQAREDILTSCTEIVRSFSTSLAEKPISESPAEKVKDAGVSREPADKIPSAAVVDLVK